MTRVSLTGGAYSSRAFTAAAQRQVNLYAEPLPTPQGEPARAALYPTPGLRALTTLPTAPVRGVRQVATGAVYAVAGSGVYLLAGNWTATLVGSITPGTTPVSMADNGIDLLIVDGSNQGWHVTLATGAFGVIGDTNFRGADRIDYVDTYFVSNVPGTPQFQVSDSLALTWDSLWFANKSAYSDLLVSLIVAKREIWLLGERSIEVFYNTGASTFPYEAQPGAFIDHGCAAKHSVTMLDNTVMWLGRDRTGQGVVLAAANYQAVRISTFAIEAEIASYPTIRDAVGYAYQSLGHRFYVLHFPAADRTWAYDLSNPGWHELVWLDGNGREHRHRGNCAALCQDTVVVGDWQNGKLYALDPSVFTDDGAPIRRMRSFPHLVADGKRVMYRQFLADMQTGIALPPPAPPVPTPAPTPAPVPGISISDGVIGPASGTYGGTYTAVVFTATLVPANASQVTAHFATVDGTAQAGHQFYSTSGTVVFLPGVTSVGINVVPIATPLTDPTRTFSLTLSSPVGAAIARATGTASLPGGTHP